MGASAYVPDQIRVRGVVNPDMEAVPKTSEQTLPLSVVGNPLFDLGMPRFAALARTGRVFVVDSGTGTAQAPATAVIVTTVKWGLHNNNPAGSNIAIIPLQVSAYLRSGTMALGLSLFAAMETAPRSTPTKYANSVGPGSTLGVSGKSSMGILTANLATFAASVAIHLEGRSSGADTAIGSGIIARPEGLLGIRPGYAMGFDVVASVGTTALFGVNVIYWEGEYQLG